MLLFVCGKESAQLRSRTWQELFENQLNNSVINTMLIATYTYIYIDVDLLDFSMFLFDHSVKISTAEYSIV